MSDIVSIISVAVAIAGFFVSLLAFIYVRCFALRAIEKKLDSIQFQIPMGGDSRVGISPSQKEVIVQQDQNQERPYTAASNNTHFISYFGVCFQPPPEQHDMIDLESRGSKRSDLIDLESKGSKMNENTNKNGNNKAPFKSIRIPQHGVVKNNNNENHNVEPNDTIQTPPTDEDSDPTSSNESSLESSPEETHGQELESNKKVILHEEHQSFEELGISVELKSNKSKEDQPSADREESMSFKSEEFRSFDNDTEIPYDESISYKSDDFKSIENTNRPCDESVSSKSDDSKSIEKSESPHDESPSYKSDGDRSVDNIDIPYDESDSYATPEEYDEKGLDLVTYSLSSDSSTMQDITKLVSNHEHIPTNSKTGNSYDSDNHSRNSKLYDLDNNPSYFSSDDERSSTIDDSDEEDSYFANEPIIPQGYMVQKINSSLSIPDLEETSGDWELSSSSEDKSETKVGSKRNSSHKLENSIDICPSCQQEYDRKDGIRFSYDENCTHLLCSSCCESGKVSKLNGECPACSKSRKKPPRIGEQQRQHQETISMSI